MTASAALQLVSQQLVSHGLGPTALRPEHKHGSLPNFSRSTNAFWLTQNLSDIWVGRCSVAAIGAPAALAADATLASAEAVNTNGTAIFDHNATSMIEASS